MIELLLSHGADVEAKNRSQGATALHIASQKGFKAIAESLLKNKANVHAVNGDHLNRNTPLHLAAAAGHIAVAELLLSNDADVNIKDGSGATPLIDAIQKKNLEMAKFLIANRANVNAISTDGSTPLHHAVSSGQPKMVELLLQNEAKTEARHDYDQNRKGFTPLHKAAELGIDIVEILLRGGANPNSTDTYGGTPIHVAAIWRKPEVAELLLAHKADVNAKTLEGDTPLLVSLKRLNTPMVELLLAHKADPNVANNKGETPLGFAKVLPGQPIGSPSSSVQKEIRELLIKHGADEYQQRRTQISVTRNHEKIYPIFKREMNSWNRFSFLEAFGIAYELHSQSQGGPWYFKETGFPFPNLARVKIHRLEGNAEREILVDLEAILKSGDCSKDIWLEWGDVIEISEKDHKLNEAWYGFSKELLETLPKCLEQTVSISVKGETTPIVLAPKLKLRNIVTATNIVAATNEDSWGVQGLDFWLNDAISFSRLLRSSSDKTRVKVTRIDPVTKRSEQQIFNLEYLYPQNDLWLRDGDVIEIPENL